MTVKHAVDVEANDVLNAKAMRLIMSKPVTWFSSPKA